jgi:hypothetical protein
MTLDKDELLFILRAATRPWWQDPVGVEFSKPARDRLCIKIALELDRNAADRVRSGRS